MKGFVKFIVKLLLLVLVILSPIIYLYEINIDESKQNYRRNHYNGEKIIILGSSHSRDAIKDGIIEKSYNLSSSGFTYEETFKEIQRLDEEGIFPDVYLISFSPFSFHKTNKKPVKSNAVFDYRLEYGDNVWLNFFNNPSRKEFLKKPSDTIITQHFVRQLSQDKMSFHAIKETKKHTQSDQFFAKKYFDQINKYCKKKGIRLIYFVSPFSISYNELIKKNERWQLDLDYMNSNQDFFEFYDYSEFFGADQKDTLNFVDSSHLNAHGSHIFTNYIKGKLFH